MIDYPNVLLPEKKVNKEKIKEFIEYSNSIRIKYNIKFV